MSVLLNGISVNGRMGVTVIASLVPTYATDPSGVTVNEGQSVIYTITTTNVTNGTTLYWTASGTVEAADFTDNAMSGSFTITDNEGTVTRTLTEDAFTEGPENLYMDIRTDSISGTIVASSALVVVGDTSLTPSDPLFNYNTLLLGTSGVDAATNNTVLDSSTNNYTVTRTGTPTQGTFSPFSQTGWSGNFNGTSEFIQVPTSTEFNFGTGDFTIEWFGYLKSATINQTIITRQSSNSGWGNIQWTISYQTSGLMVLAISTGDNTANAFATDGGVMKANEWQHIAIVRHSGVWKAYSNGVSLTLSVGTGYDLSMETSPTGAPINIGGFTSWAYSAGNISNLRIVKGTAVYTTGFTPPTAPLTAISGTSLLTLQNNRFKDNSSNNFTITRTGPPRIEAFSPFDPAEAYSASVNGASLYFNGSSYASIADTVAIRPGTGNFTYEFWVYGVGAAATQEYVYKGDGVQIYKNGGSIAVALSNNNTTTYFTTGNIGALALQQWNHIALVRNGNVYRGYVNGVMTELGTHADSPDTGTSALSIGSASGILNSTAYISDFRFVKGTAVYTAAFTPPAAPLTAIANTQVLLSGNNSGITDATAKVNINTVGNAQVSTAQSKFGGSSLFLDGTGDYITTRVPFSEYTFGTGNFTIETWLYATSVSGARTIYDGRVAGGTLAPQLFLSGNEIRVGVAGSAVIVGATTLSTNIWYHVAVVRSSGVTKLYLNGVQTGSSYTDNNNYVGSTDRPVIGATGNGLNAEYFQGYLDEFRVTRGVARYNATFTPPILAFPRY